MRPTINATFLRCRAYHHAWDDVDSLHWHPTMGEPLTLRCMRCGSERRDQIGYSTGELVTRRYVYTAGYLLGPDDDKPTHNDYVRMLVVQRRRERRDKAAAARRHPSRAGGADMLAERRKVKGVS